MFILWEPAGVMAQPAPTDEKTEADKQAAKEHFFNGLDLYKKGAYKQALKQFLKAYKLDRRPEMLFNFGLCREKLGHLKKAVRSFKRYLKALPKAPNREAVKEHIKECKRRLAEKQQETGQGEPGAPAQGDPGPPAQGEPETPAEGEPGTPAEGEPGTPAQGGPETPAEGEPGTPAQGGPETPAQGEPEAPAQGEPGTPAETTPEKAEPREGWLRRKNKRTRVQISLDLGIGASLIGKVSIPVSNGVTITDVYNFSLAPGIAVGAGIHHRPIPWLAYGGRLFYCKQTVDFSTDLGTLTGVESAGYFLHAVLGVEAYPLAFSPFDPYVGVGMGFSVNAMSVSTTVDNRDYVTYGAALHAVVGLRVYVIRWLSMGLAVRYFHNFWLQLCEKTTLIERNCMAVGDLSSTLTDSLPNQISVGLETAFHF